MNKVPRGMTSSKLEKLYLEKQRIQKKIDDANGDFFIAFGPVKELESVNKQIKEELMKMKRSNPPGHRPRKKISRVTHWTKQIERMLENPYYSWASETLEGILKTIQDSQKVTDRQIQALMNIRKDRESDY